MEEKSGKEGETRRRQTDKPSGPVLRTMRHSISLARCEGCDRLRLVIRSAW